MPEPLATTPARGPEITPAGLAAGVDLGGTNIQVGILDARHIAELALHPYAAAAGKADDLARGLDVVLKRR